MELKHKFGALEKEYGPRSLNAHFDWLGYPHIQHTFLAVPEETP